MVDREPEHHAASDDAVPMVSVVIPTFRDWARLRVCLEAVRAQTYSRRKLEVIVVNNDPRDPTSPAIELRPNERLVTEQQPGSYAARNTGVASAVGDIIAFTDSDCIPDAEWIAAGVRHLSAGAERVAGRINLFTDTHQRTLADDYELLVGFNQEHYASLGTSATANMLTWSRHFTKVGGFNDTLLSGGDMEWGMRAQAHEIPITYAHECVVRHPTRSQLGQLFRKARRVAGGKGALEGLQGQRLGLLRSILPPKSLFRILRSRELSLPRRLQVAGLAYVLKLWSSSHAGLIAVGLTRPERT